ncbi:MAG TPA: hypothetical protein VK933_02650 [Longimicrobiales bacterium]|nr:hypothetical protein [Longimicrobiales bacterium]
MFRITTSHITPFAVIVSLGLAAATVHAQETQVRGAPPEGAAVHEFQAENWKEPICTGTTEWTLEVPRGTWIQFPAAWIAVDEATARANWEHMQYEISIEGRRLENPANVEWMVLPVRFECPDRVIEGVAIAPVLYFPPVTGARTFRLRMLFDADVNDGWTTYPKGTDSAVTVTHRAND